MRRQHRVLVALVSVAALMAGVGAGALPVLSARAAAADPVLLAAGDVADCNSVNSAATAALVEQDLSADPSATVAMLGDGAYPTGDLATYNACYGKTWGQFKSQTRPTPGNHDYAVGPKRQSAPGYYGYFGSAAGDPTQGFYSYDLGAWHIVSLNSACGNPGPGCTPTPSQVQWLQGDLAAHPTACLLAYWHHPRFFSMENGGTEPGPSSDVTMSPIWDILQAHGADVVLNGHVHHYESFPRQNSAGNLDPNGMREFIVGTGGGHPDTTDPNNIAPNSLVRHDGVFGVLKLTLHSTGYDWVYQATDGTQVDQGNDTCTPGTAGPPATSPSTAPTSVPTSPHSTVPTPTASGYWMLSADGTVYPFGDAPRLADAPPAPGSATVSLAPTPSGNGAWVVDGTGRVTALGDAAPLGDVSPGLLRSGEKATSLSATPSGAGYWVFTTAGRAVPFGDAAFYGDMSGQALNGPVLGSVPTPTGHGYYMVASDGGIFAFGDARFFGSMGGKHLNAPVRSLVPAGDGEGYWLVASDGGIFAFGDAPFRGSMGGTPLNRPVTGMVRYGDGYLMVASDGGIFDFSNQQFAGSLGGNPPARPIVAVAAQAG